MKGMVMRVKNKILLKIKQKEEKRKEKVEKIWNSLTSKDWLYMENMELFSLWKIKYERNKI